MNRFIVSWNNEQNVGTIDNRLLQTTWNSTNYWPFGDIFVHNTVKTRRGRCKRNFISLGGIKSPDASLTNISLAAVAPGCITPETRGQHFFLGSFSSNTLARWLPQRPWQKDTRDWRNKCARREWRNYAAFSRMEEMHTNSGTRFRLSSASWHPFFSTWMHIILSTIGELNYYLKRI